MASVAYNIYLASEGFYVLRSGVLLFLGVVTVVVTCGVRHKTYSEDKRQFGDRNRAVFMNVQSPHKWWSTLKSAVFGTSSAVFREDSGLVCESVGKADLLSDHFDSKQSWEAVDLPLTCHPSPNHTTFAFRSREVRRLLLDLDPYGGTEPLGMFPLFLKRTADVMAPCLSVVFRRLIRLSSFPACWRQANVTPVPPNSVLICCQLPTDFRNISVV